MTNTKTPRFEVIQARHWKNVVTGATASVYGACPWILDTDKPQWRVIDEGFTVRDNKTNTVGMGRKPFDTKAEAEEFMSKWVNWAKGSKS